MLDIPLWKRVLIWTVVALGVALAAPNLAYERVERHNDAAAALAGGISSPELEADLGLWPSVLPSYLVNLGLDLRGGAHLLAEVRVEDVYVARMDALWPELRDALREARADVGPIRRTDAPAGELRVQLGEASGMARAVEIARGLGGPVVSLTGVGSASLEARGEGDVLIVSLSEAEQAATDDRTVSNRLVVPCR